MCSPRTPGRDGTWAPCRIPLGGPPPGSGAAAHMGERERTGAGSWPVEIIWPCRALWYGGLSIMLARAAAGGASWTVLRAGCRPGPNRVGRRIGRLPRPRRPSAPVPELRAGALPSDPRGAPDRGERIRPEAPDAPGGGLVGLPNSVPGSNHEETSSARSVSIAVRDAAGRRFTSRGIRRSFTSCGILRDEKPAQEVPRSRSRAVVAAGYEALADVEVRPLSVTTPWRRPTAHELGVRIGLVPILRAGLAWSTPCWN